jgi:hypothetical protein
VAHSVKLRKMVEVQDMKSLSMNGGCPAARGVAHQDLTGEDLRILSANDVTEG